MSIENPTEAERLRVALSWVDEPFVTAETPRSEIMKRIDFMRADVARVPVTPEREPDRRTSSALLVDLVRILREATTGVETAVTSVRSATMHLIQETAERVVPTVHPTLEVEAALCIWEHLLDTKESGAEGQEAIDRYWARVGTVTMRHTALSLAPWSLSVFDLLPEDIRDGVSYDWEIIPAIIETVVWTDTGPVTPLPATAAEATLKSLKGTSA